jgi:hypothetical protein
MTREVLRRQVHPKASNKGHLADLQGLVDMVPRIRAMLSSGSREILVIHET